MHGSRATISNKAPFLRFLIPLIAGIITEWYLHVPVSAAWCAFLFSMGLFLLSFSLSEFRRFQLSFITGMTVIVLFLALGSLLAWHEDIRHDPAWFAHNYHEGQYMTVVLREPLVEKSNSYKAMATVTALSRGKSSYPATGGAIIYFPKDSSLPQLDYGSVLIFSKPLQEIKNACNPGGFDYKRYSLFQGITHQVYLRGKDFVVVNERKPDITARMLFPIRRHVLSILRRYIHGEKEQGLAEALLIGYKDDLDKNLVQSYTNTGVVHVIAISGLHLGLIYWLLVQLFRPLKKKKFFRWLSPVMTIGGLWLFSLVAGAQPSVLRSAVMFTCIALGEGLSRKTSIYNSLALSAFVLLCIDPYWLWDVGFQLSYSAVLSIVIFSKPIYNWFYIKNKLLDWIWKLSSVSIAAQLLTTPFSIYHFHQFPNYFLFTNLVAVPLSSAVVLGEIFLCTASSFPFICYILGKIDSWLIVVMNSYIEKIESIPFSLWDGMQISVIQVALLLLLIAAVGVWLLESKKTGAWIGSFCLLVFAVLRSEWFCQSDRQQKLIVYNIPKRRAIDVMMGRHYFFMGDSDLLVNDFAKIFYLKPSRILYRTAVAYPGPNSFSRENFFQFGSKRVLLIDHDVVFDGCAPRIMIDLLVISKSPKLYLFKLSNTLEVRQVVFDGSVPARKIKYWTKQCDSLRIPHHDVSEKGAFVMNLN